MECTYTFIVVSCSERGWWLLEILGSEGHERPLLLAFVFGSLLFQFNSPAPVPGCDNEDNPEAQKDPNYQRVMCAYQSAFYKKIKPKHS